MAYPSNSESVAQDQLASFVRRIEAIEDRIKSENADKSEVYKEAKGGGFDVKVLRRVIADRRKDAADRIEFETVYELYWNALNGVVRAHVEIIDEFPEVAAVIKRAIPQIYNLPEPAVPPADQRPEPLPEVEVPATPIIVEADKASTEPEPEPVAADQHVAANAPVGSTASRKDAKAERIPVTPYPAGTQAPPVDTTLADHISDLRQMVPDGGFQGVAERDERTSIQRTMDEVLAKGATEKPDHSKPNPDCLDPDECGPASWTHFCERCKAVKAGKPDPLGILKDKIAAAQGRAA